ncbi:MAG: PilZ domain-containing protein [Desulfosarcina sp.]
MDQTVFISSNNTATFRCPACGKSKTADVSQYAATDKKITVNCTCACGHHFRGRLEKRKQYRKGADLPGKFTLLGENGPEDTGLVKVVDISSTGLKLKMAVPRTLPVGARLLVEFRLDDRKRTPMQKRVIVRNVVGLHVGVSFHPNEMDDPALGFYLMP